MSLVILKELAFYTTNTNFPYNNTDLIVHLGLEHDVEKYYSVIRELDKTTFFKFRKATIDVDGLSTDTNDDEDEMFFAKDAFQFQFVGVLMVKGLIIVVYPKYVQDIQLDSLAYFSKFKQILRVISKYKKRKEQQIFLSNTDLFIRQNRLGLAIKLLEHYSEYGLYHDDKAIIELNGDGEIHWLKTINETDVILSNKSPVYVDLYTENVMVDVQNIVRQIQLAVLTDIRVQFADILRLFDYDVPVDDEISLSDLGDNEILLYHLDNALHTQFVSYKLELIHLLKFYISNKSGIVNDESLTFFGVSKFDRVWEDVCKVVYNDDLEHTLSQLGLRYKSLEGDIKLKNIVPKPIWQDLSNNEKYEASKSLELDVLHVNQKTKIFEIYDAKYYLLQFCNGKLNGQPGVGDVTKQYLYELAYKEIATMNGYDFSNQFIVPSDAIEDDGKYIALASLTIFDGLGLSDIMVVSRSCQIIFEQYLSLF